VKGRIERLLANEVEEPHRTDCLAFIERHEELFDTSKGSATKHQPWPGGYRDHITEVMEIAVVTYKALETIRPLPFSLSDALLCCFLHDIEKVWKHALNPCHRGDIDKEETLESCFQLNDEHRNAIKYAHGEGDDYHPTERVQGPLGAFVHHCDNTSARIWFDKPEPGERWIQPDEGVLLLMERYQFTFSDVATMPMELQTKLVAWTEEQIMRELEREEPEDDSEV